MNTDYLPTYLTKYIVDQEYDRYTSEEQAVWRCVMKQARDFFKDHAVPIYLKGLEQTGIPIEKIPSIEEMNQKLDAFGWGAVCVEGFIPSSVFLDFLARGILPIARDIRTVEHTHYTPAPDIIHEAAGHAPIVADPDYRRFLERYSDVAYRALISKDDIRLYEAIRYLSDIKENPETSPEAILAAEKRLKETYASLQYLSEAGKVARIAWWTIEYGLVKQGDDYQIYGAGLLSSVGESRACYSDKVKKIPLTIDCVHTAYDITKPQPQLFYVNDLKELPAIIDELEKDFAFRIGGVEGLRRMQQAETINTLMLDSQVSVSGQLVYFEHEGEHVNFIKCSGPVQLAYQEKEIKGQGRDYHAEGFSSPIGRWQKWPDRSPSVLTRSDLDAAGLRVGARTKLTLVNGFEISGELSQIHFEQAQLCLLQWKNATVKRGEQVYFEPSWGVFDLVVGEQVVSVFAGPADRAAFGDYYVGEASTKPSRSLPYSEEEQNIFKLFEKTAQLRTQNSSPQETQLAQLGESILQVGAHHWLLQLEYLECADALLKKTASSHPVVQQVYRKILELRNQKESSLQEIIDTGLNNLSFLK